MDIPYTQQFSVKQTPLKTLLPILRQHAGDRAKLKTAVESAFFKGTKSSEKIAGNTVIALKAHGIIEATGALTAFGKTLINLSPEAAEVEVARNILKNRGGFQVVETLREMKRGGHDLSLIAVTAELKSRGLTVSDNSSDLSGVRGWLEAAGILKGWEVLEDQYAKIIGAEAKTIDALKDLTVAQVAFLRAMVALNVQDFTTYTSVVTHAESLFAGQVTFNKKLLEKEIVQPLETAGFIEVRRPPKSVPGARGGKPADVRPTSKFDTDVATPLLESLFKNAGRKDLRRIRSVPLAQLVADVRQNRDINLKGQALEMLAIRFCQLLGLEFVGWRQTEDKVSAGGEVDAVMQSTRLIYSRWQIQCKATDKIAYETLAKEYGVAAVSLASVILIVSTGALTPGAAKYRAHIVQKTALNMIVIDGTALDAIVAAPSVIGSILETQARDAMRLKEQLLPLQTVVLPGA
jgi:site-specific DNA-methyltransferase (cytosine-N4-specific)